MKALYNCSTGVLPGSCGYGIVYNHGHNRGARDTRLPGGTGICVAAFVNEMRCKEVYDWILANCEILYQSPVEMNRNSGRPNFLVVFKEK